MKLINNKTKQYYVKRKYERRQTDMKFTSDVPVYKRISFLIDNMGFKKKSIAEKSNIKNYTFYRMMKGERPITTDEIKNIAKAMNIPVTDFFNDAV